MIVLDESLVIGKGGIRTCYRHPERDDQCIKIYHGEFAAKSQAKELKELRRLRRKKNLNLIIPRFHGKVPTSLGEGYLFDRVENEDGSNCLNFAEWLADKKEEADFWCEQLLAKTVEDAVVVSELHSKNYLVREEKNGVRFCLVDGLGEGTFIKICSLFPYFARKKAKRKFQFLEAEIRELFGPNSK